MSHQLSRFKMSAEPLGRRSLRVLLLGAAIFVGVSLAVPPASSYASELSHVARAHSVHAHPKVLVSRRVSPSVGGFVRARNGVSIFVPPGVMTRPGRVAITYTGRGVYDVHIFVPWHGTVAVSLPLRRKSDVIVHQVGGIWLTEGVQRGQRTVWVQQLSRFTNLVGKIGNKVTGSLCLVFNRSEFIKCVVEKGIKHVNSKLASWIEAHLPGGCRAHLIEAGVLGGGPAGIFLAALTDPACIEHTGETPVPHSQSHPKPPGPPPQTNPQGQPPNPQPQPPSQTWSEQETPNHPVNTFMNYHNASGMGPAIGAGQWVQVACKVHDPAVQSVNPDGYWYRIASSPWNGSYYSPANTFMNGDPYGGPYTHNTDFAVPNC